MASYLTTSTCTHTCTHMHTTHAHTTHMHTQHTCTQHTCTHDTHAHNTCAHTTHMHTTHTCTHTHPHTSSYHSAPLKLHLVDVGGLFSFSKRLSKPLPSPSRHQGPMYDSVFVLSSGRITSIGPQGEFNWQVREVGGERERK